VTAPKNRTRIGPHLGRRKVSLFSPKSGYVRRSEFSVTLHANWRLVFRPNHNPLPQLKDGGLDLSAVTSIELIEVVDYHGN